MLRPITLLVFKSSFKPFTKASSQNRLWGVQILLCHHCHLH